MNFRSKNEDRLSYLPDEVLGHILSLMPTKFAVKTSTLSKKWKHNWTLVTNLDFDRIRSVNAVDSVLKLCKTSQLKLFRFRNVSFPLKKSNLLKWINEAVRLKVCELDIQVWQTKLPLSLFTCKTLTELRLAMHCGFDINCVPSRVMLPGLKTLDISVGIKHTVIVSRFVHGCPLLESLSLEIMCCDYDEQYCALNIPTLKRLELRTRINILLSNKYVLNVPNLEYLYVGGYFCPHFVMEDLPSAVEATVSFSDTKDYGVELLKGLSGVKSLSWSISLHFCIFLLRRSLPKFPNLKHLELKGRVGSQWILVTQILESCSELEHLCFEEPRGSCLIKLLSIPTCMLSNLKTIKITRCKGQRECDIRFLEYILGNAEVLKRLTIICENLSNEEEKELRVRLLRFPRASRFCDINFVGKWLNYAPN